GRLLDDEHQVALLHVLTFVEEPLLQETVDARAEVDLVLRLHSTCERHSWRDLVLRNRDDGNGRRREIGLRLLLGGVAPMQNQQQWQAGQCGEARMTLLLQGPTLALTQSRTDAGVLSRPRGPP